MKKQINTLLKETQEVLVISGPCGDLEYFGLIPKFDDSGALSDDLVQLVTKQKGKPITPLGSRCKRGIAYRRALKEVFGS